MSGLLAAVAAIVGAWLIVFEITQVVGRAMFGSGLDCAAVVGEVAGRAIVGFGLACAAVVGDVYGAEREMLIIAKNENRTTNCIVKL